jgi:hypothetical protein
MFVQGNNGCLFSDPYKTHKYTGWQNVKLLNVKLAVHMVTTGLQRVTIAKHNSIAMQFLVSREYKMTQQQQCNGHTQDAPELGSVHPV